MAFRDLILRNFWLKGFSLVLATLIWFALSQANLQTDIKPLNPLLARGAERQVTRAVTVLKHASEAAVFRVEPSQVAVTLSGSRHKLDQLNPEDVQVYVNVAGSREPKGAMKVEVHVPREVTVHAITPPIVDVQPISTNP